MRYIKHKVFWAWDFEKEEKWLNEMSAKGLQLAAVGFCKYIFEDSVKGEYAYRLELLEEGPSNPESISYIKFLEETGIEYIGSVTRWAYFRKKTADGPFEIYSDIASRIKHYKRIQILIIAAMSAILCSDFSNLNIYMESKDPINLVFSILCFLFTLLIGTGIFKMSKEIRRLKKEKTIRE